MTASNESTSRSDDPVLRIDGLEKRYGDGESTTTAVEGADLTVDRGEVVGLLGPNGAGKTTTIKCALGLVAPDAGTVRIDGTDPHESPRTAYGSAAAVLEGARNVYWRLTVRENLRFFAGLQGVHPDDRRDEHDRLLETLDLAAKDDEVARNLSRGMQQKLALACALARDTPLVFLDEPTLGLDVEATRDLRSELERMASEDSRAIVVSTHDMDTVREICDRVVVLNEGRVVVDRPVEELLDLFRTRAYRIRFATVGDAEGRLERFDADWDGETATVTLPEPETLYELIDRLRDAGAVVDELSAIEPDLEDVFLRITGENWSVGDDSTPQRDGNARESAGEVST